MNTINDIVLPCLAIGAIVVNIIHWHWSGPYWSKPESSTGKVFEWVLAVGFLLSGILACADVWLTKTVASDIFFGLATAWRSA